MSEFWAEQELPIRIVRNLDTNRPCSYCVDLHGFKYDKELKKTVFHDKVNMAYWVVGSIHPERIGRVRGYCLECLKYIQSDGTSLQEQLTFGATYTHNLSTGEGL